MALKHTSDDLTMVAIAEATGMHLSTLKRYMAVPANRDLFGAYGQPPVYPAASLPDFLRLAELHEEGIATPRTLAGIAGLLLSDRPSPSVSAMPSKSAIRNPDSHFRRRSLYSFRALPTVWIWPRRLTASSTRVRPPRTSPVRPRR